MSRVVVGVGCGTGGMSACMQARVQGGGAP